MVDATKINLPIFLASLLLLAGCSSSDNSDLIAFMDQTRSDAASRSRIDPLPAYPPYVAVVYGSAGLRSPFQPPRDVVIAEIRGKSTSAPDLARPKEYLERFNIAQLSMVGTIEKEGTRWALVRDGGNSVHRVSVGNHIGQNYGQIMDIRPTGIDLVEVVVNGQGGWIERPRSLNMRSE